MTAPRLPLICLVPTRQAEALAIAERFGFVCCDDIPEDGYWLALDEQRLELRYPSKHGAIYVEFVEGSAAHRRQFGGGAGQPVAKAVGIKGGYRPSIVDATAGLGRDAFVMASLGATVTLIERAPIAAALLADGLQRATAHPDTADIAARMTLVHADAAQWLTDCPQTMRPDVVYLDPMFPDTGKAALAKKDMQAFQTLIGDDLDSERLLSAALNVAKKRIVVKRPRLGPPIDGPKPSAQHIGKSTRFDLYAPKTLAATAD